MSGAGQRAGPSRRGLAAILHAANHAFDALYRSDFNPLYRSGTLAVGMLIVLLATGLYLLFLYNVGAPYESIERIQSQAWAGRWMRAMHRYATDLAILATVFHILQMLAQGRTWGARVLAWISGFLLLGALMFSAWTGYVMVWDVHGQWVGEAGARLAGTLPLLGDAHLRIFGGARPITSSFFFMNLFLHVAIPLVMVIGIWVHTARLAKPRWLPHGRAFVPLMAALAVVSVAVAAPLLPKADVLRLTGRMRVDLFTSFWLPLIDRHGALAGAAVTASAGLLLLLVPWWWKGNRTGEIARVAAARCIGCARCFRDCPFEAITMSGREDGSRLLLSVVDPARCVECGLCVASCSDDAITLPSLSVGHQAALIDQYAPPGRPPVDCALLYCRTNPGLAPTLRRLAARFPGLVAVPIGCAGQIHADTVRRLLDRAGRVVVLSCPGENCQNRWGYDLARERLEGGRKPGLADFPGRGRVAVLAESGCEYRRIAHALARGTEAARTGARGSRLRAAAAHGTLLLVIALFSAWRAGSDPESAAVRLFLRLPGYLVDHREAWSEQEKSDIPEHMRLPSKVVRVPARYDLRVVLDGQPLATRGLRVRRDGQEARFAHEVRLRPGRHALKVVVAEAVQGVERVLVDRELDLTAGAVEVFSIDGKALWSGERAAIRGAPESP